MEETKQTKTALFITKARAIHGDKYDYSKVGYINATTKVCIICKEHGEFWQQPSVHTNMKCGCPKCGAQIIQKKLSSNKEEFIEKAKKIHGNKYDYSKVEYINEKTNVCIICPKHGEFWQTPGSHLRGGGCRLCANEQLSEKRKISTEEWVARAKKIHNNLYSYDLTKYNGYYNKLCIICPKHGEFWQIAYDHLQGKGCPKCRRSKLEIEMANFLKEHNVEFEEQYRPSFLSNGRSHMSLDFYLPEYNSAIECQGLQHFKEQTHFEHRNTKISDRDKRKYELCKQANMKLFYYSNIKCLDYLDTVFLDKNELLNEIKNGKKLL